MVRWNSTKFRNNNPNTCRFAYVQLRSIPCNFSPADTKCLEGSFFSGHTVYFCICFYLCVFHFAAAVFIRLKLIVVYKKDNDTDNKTIIDVKHSFCEFCV